jgi:type I restriction enzyme S subunit
MAFQATYPAYQESGRPWVPKVPQGWNVLRNGRLFTHRVQTGFPDLPILEVSLRTGVRVRDMENLKRKQVMSQKEKYKRAAKGDIAYNMMRMWQGALGPAPVDGLVSPAYVVVKPFEDANSAYYSYLFRTDAYMREVNKFSRGIVADRNRLYWDEFKQMPSLVPPRPQQDQIVAYLQAQDVHIAHLIKAKRDLIGLLAEQKLRVIDHAVTRGLDASVKLKPSGIEWLGEVPRHWDARKLKFVTNRIVGGSTPKSDEPRCWEGDVVWVTPKDVSKIDLLTSSLRTITREGLRSCSSTLVPAGSIVITSRAPVGNVALAGVDLCTNQGCKAIVPACVFQRL